MRAGWFFITIVLGGCGSCEDEASVDFFEPETYGTYRFEPEPDIDVPRVVDFGQVAAGESSTQAVLIRNVGRLELDVVSADVGPQSFELSGPWVSNIPSRDGRYADVTYFALDSRPVSGAIELSSNDPDEPVVTIALVANREQPCIGGFEPGAPVWEVHDGEGPMCFPDEAASHGDPAEYDYAEIPLPGDSGWEPEPDDRISFERRSTLCGFECSCRTGGDFTYFQTTLLIPQGAAVRQYRVDIDDVDDGARVTVFNERYPDGVTDPSSYARLPGGSTADLARYFTSGLNRIVITHVDDCCSISRIANVTVTSDGDVVGACR